MSVANALPRKRFTRTEVEQMCEAGLFVDQRLELIDGDLIDKMGQNPPHFWVIQFLCDLLFPILGRGRVRVQGPIEVQTADQEWSLPEPDISILKEQHSDLLSRFPNGSELLLVVEVADSSLPSDLTIKRDLYARAGVPEYWVLDIRRRCAIVHRNPDGGRYVDTRTFSESETVSLQGTDVSIVVGQMLPALPR